MKEDVEERNETTLFVNVDLNASTLNAEKTLSLEVPTSDTFNIQKPNHEKVNSDPNIDVLKALQYLENQRKSLPIRQTPTGNELPDLSHLLETSFREEREQEDIDDKLMRLQQQREDYERQQENMRRQEETRIKHQSLMLQQPLTIAINMESESNESNNETEVDQVVDKEIKKPKKKSEKKDRKKEKKVEREKKKGPQKKKSTKAKKSNGTNTKNGTNSTDEDHGKGDIEATESKSLVQGKDDAGNDDLVFVSTESLLKEEIEPHGTETTEECPNGQIEVPEKLSINDKAPMSSDSLDSTGEMKVMEMSLDDLVECGLNMEEKPQKEFVNLRDFEEKKKRISARISRRLGSFSMIMKDHEDELYIESSSDETFDEKKLEEIVKASDENSDSIARTKSNSSQPDKITPRKNLNHSSSKRKFKRAKKVDDPESFKKLRNSIFVHQSTEFKVSHLLSPIQSEKPWTSGVCPINYRLPDELALREKKPRLSIGRMSLIRQAPFFDSTPKELNIKQRTFISNTTTEKLNHKPVKIIFHLSNTPYQTLLECNPHDSLQQLKEIAFTNFENMIPADVIDKTLRIIDEYVLEWTDTLVFLTEEDATVEQLQIFSSSQDVEHITFTERSYYELQKIKLNQVNKLLNSQSWKSTLENEVDEKTYYRKNVYRNLVASHRKTFKLAQTTKAPVPPYIPPKFKVSFLTAPGMSKAVGASPNTEIGEIIDEAQKKLGLPQEEAYVIKICGRKEYIIDRTAKITRLECIRIAHERKRLIYFTLVKASDLGCVVDPVTRTIIPPWEQNIKPVKAVQSFITENLISEEIKRTYKLTEENPVVKERPLIVSKMIRENFGVGVIYRQSPTDANTKSLSDSLKCFEVRINSISNLVLGTNSRSLNFTNISLYVEVGLYFGGEPIVQPLNTVKIPWETPLIWDEVIAFDSVLMKNLPLETRMCITLIGKDRNSELPLACISLKLFDHNRKPLSGPRQAYLWLDDNANPIGFCGSNEMAQKKNQNVLSFELEQYPFPITYYNESDIVDHTKDDTLPVSRLVEEKLMYFLSMDSLWFPNVAEKKLLWKFRHWILKNAPNHLNKLALSVPWTDPIQKKHFWQLLDEWPLLDPNHALELLDARYNDFKVRAFAVQSLGSLSDEVLSLYLLQLVQVLKYEPYHYSPLALFLLERALINETSIAIPLFWYVKSELHIPENSERFGLILETILLRCSEEFREEIGKQILVVNSLNECALKVKTYTEQKRTGAIRNLLAELKLPKEFTLPLDPVKQLSSIIDIPKCRCFDSAKAPILVCFNSSDPLWEEKSLVIFKEGDDLRQDALTLQLLTLMDQIWKNASLDLHMTPYRVSVTGDGTGLIEVVPDSKTTASIQRDSGITLAAFSEKPLRQWFEEKAPSQQEFMTIVDNFVLSCAGYCVATYVLGIGDRHNSNIMVDTKGHLFHIDFGHFLGNYKSWKRIWDREKAPFVFTPEFAFVMGGKDSDRYEYFIRQCVRAYNIVRKEGNFILTLFTMMLSTGIPELRSASDLLYIRDSLSQELTDEEAKEKFTQLIDQSLNCKTTQLNGFFHLLAH